MDFQTFKDTVKDMIRDYLPPEYQEAEIMEQLHTKLNESYHGMTVKLEQQHIVPTINLDRFYQAYEKGEISLSDALKEMAMQVQQELKEVDFSQFFEYDRAKEQLFIRVNSAEQNQEVLKNVPHQLMEDLVITYHIAADISQGSIASTLITNDMIKYYGITEEQLHKDALENTEKIFPAKVQSMETVMKELILKDMLTAGLDDEEVERMIQSIEDAEQSSQMIVVTNRQGINGAAVMFYPDEMDRLSIQFQGDFYILPSSTHEMLIIPDNGNYRASELKSMVTEINETQVLPEDRLTNEVYHYSAKDRVFEKAEIFESRQKMKAQNKTIEKEGMTTPKKNKSQDMSL